MAVCLLHTYHLDLSQEDEKQSHPAKVAENLTLKYSVQLELVRSAQFQIMSNHAVFCVSNHDGEISSTIRTHHCAKAVAIRSL